MLTLTDNAAVVVNTLTHRTLGQDAVTAETAPEQGGLRIASTPAGDNFEVAVAPHPEPSDQVVETAGARVYLEPVAATALDDKVLDAQVDEQGAVRFSLAHAG
ncbi:Fe-S cluster assembly protein HesB [Herbiconiux sp. YIM B11900]|uniref:Fe-S cluster assembly protein HesB n=1 Tax=Herbiconiux sp. YIM B11900 TaxID=3404131 RepID=UPI003F82FF77